MTKMSRARTGQRPLAETCADCGAGETNWVSVNRGVYLCNDCLSVHRHLGRHISNVKHLKKSYWHPYLLNMVQHLAGAGANSIWEHTLLDPAQTRGGKRKPNPSDHIYPKKDDFIRAKYLLLNYVHRLNHGDGGDVSMQLHSSVRTGNLETSLRLLSLGADANFIHPEKRNTPLHVAAKAGQTLQVELLATYGADPCTLDPSRKSPEDLARAEGHTDLADRLVELQYELTDRLTYYVCHEKPDHKAGIHYKLTTSLNQENEGSKKLESLNDQTFMELAMDVFDEVDRRDLEQIWQDTQRSIIIPGNKSNQLSDNQSVPFLPVIPHYSPTRNQGRQKLALFIEPEFKKLISDIILDAVRRQNLLGSSIVETMEDDPIYDMPPDGMLDYNSIEQSAIAVERNEISNPTVSMEKYEELHTKYLAKDREVSKLQEQNRELTAKVTALAKERHELSKLVATMKAATATPAPPPAPAPTTATEVQSPFIAKLGPKSPGGRPNSVYNDSSSSQSSLHSADGRRRTICGEGQFDESTGRVPSHEELRQPLNIPKGMKEEMDGSRAESEYDNDKKAEENQAQEPSTSPNTAQETEVEALQNNTNSNNNQPSPTNTDVAPAVEDTLSTNTNEPVKQSGSSPTSNMDDSIRPDKVDMQAKTDQLTRNIQALHSAAQFKKIENYLQCAENVYSAVNDLIALFPKPNCDKTVKTVIQQIYGSAHTLRQKCKEITQEEIDNNEKVKQITEEVMAYAYEVAKAEKQLVSL